MGFIQHLSKGLHRISTQTLWFSVFIEVLEKPWFYLLLRIYRMASVHIQPSQQTFVLMKARRLWSSSSEDVFIKINIFVLVICLQDVFKTFSRRFQDVLKTSSRRVQDILRTSSRRIIKLNCSWEHNFKTSANTIIY